LNLLRYGEFTFNPGGTPTSIRPPLFPTLVAAIYEVAGESNFAAVRMFLAALSLLTVVVAYLLGRAAASRPVALWLAGMVCLYPSLLAYNNLLLTEVPFTFLLTSTCLLVVLSIQRRSVALAAAAGLALGLAALTRSVVWLAPPFLAAYLLITWRGTRYWRLAGATAMLAAFAGTVAPWAVRNSRLQDTFVAIDVMGGRNFMMGNYQYTPLHGSWSAIAIEGEQSWIHEVTTTYPPDQRGSQGKIDKLALAQGVKFAREHVGLTLLRSSVKFFDFWGLERELIAGASRGDFGHVLWPILLGLTVLITGSYAAVMFLGILGLVFSPPTNRQAHWLFLCVIGFVCGLHTIAFGHSRYHLPLMPLVLVYTACALSNWPVIWQQRRSARMGLAAGLCSILVAGWVWNFVAVDWELFANALRSTL
jgi:4-amino-4-deoxy-L-arabinose transferase-like glycosyltransferase